MRLPDAPQPSIAIHYFTVPSCSCPQLCDPPAARTLFTSALPHPAVASVIQQRAAGSLSAAEHASGPAGSAATAQGNIQPAAAAAASTPARSAANQAAASPIIGLATPPQMGGAGATPAGGGDAHAAGTPASPAHSLGTPSWRPAGASGLLDGFTPSPLFEQTSQSAWDTAEVGGSAGTAAAAGSPPSLAELALAAGGQQVSAKVKPAFAAWSAAEAQRRQEDGRK